MNLTYVLGVLLFATQPSLAGTHYKGAWQDADDDNERYEQNSHMAEKDHYGMNFNISFTSSVGRVMSKKKEKKKKIIVNLPMLSQMNLTKYCLTYW